MQRLQEPQNQTQWYEYVYIMYSLHISLHGNLESIAVESIWLYKIHTHTHILCLQ